MQPKVAAGIDPSCPYGFNSQLGKVKIYLLGSYMVLLYESSKGSNRLKHKYYYKIFINKMQFFFHSFVISIYMVM